MMSDDLASLFPALSQFEDLGFHMGEVVAWDPQTGRNTIRVLGTELQDLPMLNLTEALTMTVGSMVGLLRSKSTLFILGRIAKPATSQFFSGAMPAMPAAFYQINTDAPLQTGTADGGYYAKFIGGYTINHPRVEFGVDVVVSGATATGAFKVQWFPNDNISTGPDPVGGTTMANETGLTGGGAHTRFDLSYTWPEGMRGERVYIAFMPSLTTGASGDWAHAMPRYFVGVNE